MTAETDISGLYGETDFIDIFFAILFWGGVGLVCLSPFILLVSNIYHGCECEIVEPKQEIDYYIPEQKEHLLGETTWQR